MNYNHFIKYNIGNGDVIKSQEACFVYNGKLHCLKVGLEHYEENKLLAITLAGEDNCDIYSTGDVYCTLYDVYPGHDFPDLYLDVLNDGEIYVAGGGLDCLVEIERAGCDY